MTVKDAENIKLDPDVYSRCVATAKGYYRMLQRQKEIEEEIADVQIMLWQMELLYGYGCTEHEIERKIDRLKERIEAIRKPHQEASGEKIKRG